MQRTYSSYELDKFQRCPRLWDLSRRWYEPEDGFNPYITLGAVVAVGLKAARTGFNQEQIESMVSAELESRYEDNPEWSVNGLLKHSLRAVELGMSTDLGIVNIISADEKQYGNSRPDVVGRMKSGALRIVDDKVKLRLDSKYLGETLADYRHSNQLYEYAWEIGKFYGEVVDSVCINLIVLSPVATSMLYPIVLTGEQIEQWVMSADVDFDEMTNIAQKKTIARVRWTSCIDKWRHECPMHQICHDLVGDESRASMWLKRRRGRG